jgi:hypothetical protein
LVGGLYFEYRGIGGDEMKIWKRPEVLESYTKKIKAPCGSIYCIFGSDENKLKEIGLIRGKCGTCNNMLLRVISILISKLLQTDLPRDEIIDMLEKQFEGNCGNGAFYFDGVQYHSCIDFMFKKMVEDLASRGEIEI